MKRKYLLVLLIVLCCITTYIHPLFAYDNGDLQLWGTLTMEGKVAKIVKLKLEEELRSGDTMKQFHYCHTDFGIGFAILKWLSAGVNYRQVFELKKGDWISEYRPHLNISFKKKIKILKIEDRSRLEFRFYDHKDTAYRYRNKLALTLSGDWTKADLKPYIANEMFVSFDETAFNRNRVYAGLKIKLVEHLYSDIYYLWQISQKKTLWISYHVIGIKLNIKF